MSAVSIDDARRRRGAAGTRVPPHDLQAEESLLGAMLLSRDAIASAIEMCTALDFYKPAHGHVFEAIQALNLRAEPVDPVTVADELRRSGLLEAIGGPSTLISLQAGTPATSNAARYARIVEEHARLRKLIAAAGEIAELGYELPEDVGAAIETAERLIFGVRRQDAGAARTLADGVDDWLELIDERHQAGGAVQHPFGLRDLDDKLGGRHKASMVVVAGRPGMGKTSLGGQLAINVASRGEQVLILSVEMSYEELLGRFVAQHAKMPSFNVTQGRFPASKWNEIVAAAGAVAQLPITILDSPAATLGMLRAAARRMVTKAGPLGLVIVDYVQLMTTQSSRRNDNRQVEVSELARGLKLMAKELGCCIVALAQINRGVEGRKDKRPTLADLRESGEIENAADAVVFVFREDYYRPDATPTNVAELGIAKNRHGATGTVKVMSDVRSGRWVDLARDDGPPQRGRAARDEWLDR